MPRTLLVPFLACFLSSLSWAQTERDIEYAQPGGEPQLLDVFVPEGEGPFPTAILVHGGGFEAGDKQTYITYIFEPLSKAGFVWFSINYRLSPAHEFPAATDDVETAIRWVKANAARYKVDVGRIALIGESAGGHLVSYVGARQPAGAEVAAVVPFYGIHDFVAFAAHHQGDSAVTGRFLGHQRLTAENAAEFVAASPVNFANPNAPPFLMIHGVQDKGVPFQQSLDMCAALARHKVSCEILPVDAGHGMNNWEPNAELHFYKQRMVDWLRKTLNVQ